MLKAPPLLLANLCRFRLQLSFMQDAHFCYRDWSCEEMQVGKRWLYYSICRNLLLSANNALQFRIVLDKRILERYFYTTGFGLRYLMCSTWTGVKVSGLACIPFSGSPSNESCMQKYKMWFFMSFLFLEASHNWKYILSFVAPRDMACSVLQLSSTSWLQLREHRT